MQSQTIRSAIKRSEPIWRPQLEFPQKSIFLRKNLGQCASAIDVPLRNNKIAKHPKPKPPSVPHPVRSDLKRSLEESTRQGSLQDSSQSAGFSFGELQSRLDLELIKPQLYQHYSQSFLNVGVHGTGTWLYPIIESDRSRSLQVTGNAIAELQTLQSQHQSQKKSCGSKVSEQFQKVPKPSHKKGGVSIDDFLVVSLVGVGAFGHVYLCRHLVTGMLVALKQISKQTVCEMSSQFLLQLKIQLLFEHPNIVQAYGCFSDDLHLYIVMEYMEQGNLYEEVKKQGCIHQVDRIRNITREVAKAVHFLHQNGVMHRDIKPQNVVLSNGVSKLCDFTWATAHSVANRRKTYCGTLDYIPPQVIGGKEYSCKVDVWCIGVLAYEMSTGCTPFYHEERDETYSRILGLQIAPHSQLQPQVEGFVRRVLVGNQTKRFDIQQLLNDQFLKQ